MKIIAIDHRNEKTDSYIIEGYEDFPQKFTKALNFPHIVERLEDNKEKYHFFNNISDLEGFIENENENRYEYLMERKNYDKEDTFVGTNNYSYFQKKDVYFSPEEKIKTGDELLEKQK